MLRLRSSLLALSPSLLLGAAEPPQMSKLPLGITPELYGISVPAAKVPTLEKAALGKKLFNDTRLSADNTVSCATCHDPAKGFADGKTTSIGIKGQKTTRNSPTVLNALFNPVQFWDGRAVSLEAQAKLPITNAIEMGMKNGDQVVAKLKAIPEYVAEFKSVFGRELTFDDLASAIAAFERTLISGNSPFDRFIGGDAKAMDDAANRGWSLFNGKGRCNTCHAGNAVTPLFTDQKFHNIGVAARKQNFLDLAKDALRVVRSGDKQQIDELAIQSQYSELGRFLVTKYENHIGGFKTPSLRNTVLTAPYMHDGSLATLWDVMDHYNKGGEPNPYLDGGMQRLALTESEIDELVAFMAALTDDRFANTAKAQLAKQRAKKNVRPQRDVAAAFGKKGNLGDAAPNPDLSQKNPADIGVF